MPFVFIHGVRQRNQQGLERLKAQLADMLVEVRKQVDLPADFAVRAPFWGGDGVAPAHVSINPATARADRGLEANVPTDPAEALQILSDACNGDEERMRALLRNELTDLPSKEREDAELLMQQGLEAAFSQGLQKASYGELESAHVLMKRKRFQRLFDAAERAASRAALGSSAVQGWFDEMQDNVAKFMGDAMLYVIERERCGADSPILRKVIAALPAKQDGEPLIVMTHSMGGAILFDILKCYRPELRVDCWISVGSQVAQFHNLGLLKIQDRALQASERESRALSNVRNWINISDPLDMLCYLARPVFPSARDVEYRTSRGPFGNHSWYFREQAFYDLVTGCIVEALTR